MAKGDPVKEEGKAEGGQQKGIMMLIGLNTLLLMIFGAGGAYMVWVQSSQPEIVATQAPMEVAGTDDNPVTDYAGAVGPKRTMKPFVVNLADPGGDRYLRAAVEVELTTEDMAQEFDHRKGRIRHEVIAFLSSLRFSQTQGAQNKEEIRNGVLNRVNAQMSSGRVLGVYITEFVVQ